VAYSLSARKAPQRKTAYTEGALAPSDGEAIELRVEEGHFASKGDFWSTVAKLLERVRETANPKFPN
jgi:hypothetical protein